MRISVAVLGACLPLLAAAQPAGGFRHIVIVVQENRTPDNLFGSDPQFEPGVDIATSGLNSANQTVPLTAERIDSCYDISHTHDSFTALYATGRMNGADREKIKASINCQVPSSPQFKFADNSTGTVQPYFDMASQYGFANRMFETSEGPSYPAHQFLFGGTAAPAAGSALFVAENPSALTNAGCAASKKLHVAVIDQYGSETSNPPVFTCFDRPTMADRLDAAGLSWTYYLNTGTDSNGLSAIWNAPASILRICQAKRQAHGGACTGGEYTRHVDSRQAQILSDVQHCKLPAVSWVIPNSADSDHAGVTGATGPDWVASIVNAVGQQPACAGGETYWNDTAILITWDDWGGWYDHVPPFLVKGPGTGWGAGYTYGFRVPLLVVSAYTPPGFVDNTNHDFGSLLQFMETNFNLGRIGAGGYADAYATNLLEFFTLSTPRAFSLIQARHGAGYFLTTARSGAPLDD